MPFLIDGHNLIGQMRGGLHLGDPEDEAKLIALLKRFCARTRSRVTVIFDQGIPGSRKPASSGGLTVRFALPPRTADDEIRNVLKRLGGEARNWVVVSSDGDVRSIARSFGARIMSGAEFLRQQLSRLSATVDGEKPEPSADTDEISEWMRLFGERRGSSKT